MSKYLVKIGYNEYEFKDKAKAMFFAELGFTHAVDKKDKVCITLIESDGEEDGTVPDTIEVEEVEG